DDEQMHARLGAALEAYRSGGGSVAMISQPLSGIDTVAIDNATGASELADALLGLGYRRFAVLAGPPGHLTARERLDGFVSGLAGRKSPAGTGAITGKDDDGDPAGSP